MQYLTLHSEDHASKGPAYNVYSQVRRTRKILRFLRTIEHTTAIRREVKELMKEPLSPPAQALKIFTILEHLFTVLFFLCDHRVFLGELEVISKEQAVVNYPRSMKMYRLQNIFGALKSLAEIVVIFMEGTYEGEVLDMEMGAQVMKSKILLFIRNILDIFVANYYLHRPQGQAFKIGIIGVITSLIALCQALKLI